MLIAITLGSLARSPMIFSAGGQEEHPCDVNSSTTARGSAWAGRMIATIAQTPSAPDHRETQLLIVVVAMGGNREESAPSPLPRAAVNSFTLRQPVCRRD